MTISTQHVGLDVHRDTLSIAVADEGGNRGIRFFGAVPNSGDALAKALATIGKDGTHFRLSGGRGA